MCWSSSSSNERKSGVSGGVNNLLSQKLDGRHVMAYIRIKNAKLLIKQLITYMVSGLGPAHQQQ
jgi:hypothetical protein